MLMTGAFLKLNNGVSGLQHRQETAITKQQWVEEEKLLYNLTN